MAPFKSIRFQLTFRSLFNSGRGFAFECDEQGQVDMDGMSKHARNNYFFARAMVGRDLSPPVVERVAAPAMHFAFAEPALA